MSIVLFDKSICPICGQVIRENDDYFLFPPFVVNILDPLYLYSDEATHQSCLETYTDASTARKYAEWFMSEMRPDKRVCFISGEPISRMGSDVFVNLLSSTQSDYLHNFNFIHFDKRNLATWPLLIRFRLSLENLHNSALWQEVPGGNYLKNLILILDRNDIV